MIEILYLIGVTILYILAALFVLMVMVLFAVIVIPFHYDLAGRRYDSTRLEGRITWFFGGIRVRFAYDSDTGYRMGLNIFGFKKNIEAADGEKQQKADENANGGKKERKHKKKGNPPAYSYITAEVIKKGLQTVLKMFNHCKPKKFCAEASIGFDDPMYTGLLYGIQFAGYDVLSKYSIRIRPDFDEEKLEGNFIIGGSLQLFYLMLVAAGFLFARPLRSILFKNIKFKIKRRLKKWRTTSILAKT